MPECRLIQMLVERSIVRVLVLHVAHEHSSLVVPALEVSSRERHDSLLGLLRQGINIFFRYVAYGLVIRTTRSLYQRSVVVDNRVVGKG